jgi:predicted signal transduction protein with EAL and GGDEF domain
VARFYCAARPGYGRVCRLPANTFALVSDSALRIYLLHAFLRNHYQRILAQEWILAWAHRYRSNRLSLVGGDYADEKLSVDQAIKALVETCQKNLRVIDHFGRIGGEEFICLLPETAEPEATLCAERLRRSIEVMRIRLPSGYLQITASIGVAVLNSGHAGWESLLKDADGALYRAKNSGRNRVVLAE